MDPPVPSLTRLAPGRLHRHHDHAMTTAVLTSEQESVPSEKDPEEQKASTRASHDAGNPFLDVRRAWNGVWEESLSNGRRWRLMALVEAGLLALALFGLIHLGR